MTFLDKEEVEDELDDQEVDDALLDSERQDYATKPHLTGFDFKSIPTRAQREQIARALQGAHDKGIDTGGKRAKETARERVAQLDARVAELEKRLGGEDDFATEMQPDDEPASKANITEFEDVLRD
ncbi:hypothetical protein LCGC14_1696090, partial [marine sediment metagenome]